MEYLFAKIRKSDLLATIVWSLLSLTVAAAWLATHPGAARPFEWAWGALTLALALPAFGRRSRAARIIAVNASAFAALFLGAEFYCDAPHPISVDTPKYCPVDDDELGYRNAKDVRASSAEFFGKEKLYDAVYSLDHNGWRRTPEAPATAPAVLFFGDSFTFGWGVDDAEAFPAVFESKSRGRYLAVNLSVNGWGPHQMLRMLQLGKERSAAGSHRPAAAFYFALPIHVERAAGLMIWDQRGPRYEIDGSGTLRYRGAFHGRLWAKVVDILSHSNFLSGAWYRLIPRIGGGRRDIDRFVAVVAESRRLFHERYGGELYVVMNWPDDLFPMQRQLCRGAVVCLRTQELGVPDHRLPGYFISAKDRHPSARWHQALGTALAGLMLARPAP
ncbi:MAG: hypothetical protein ACHQ2Z_10240 [Elusimicrobiota bacterium]